MVDVPLGDFRCALCNASFNDVTLAISGFALARCANEDACLRRRLRNPDDTLGGFLQFFSSRKEMVIFCIVAEAARGVLGLDAPYLVICSDNKAARVKLHFLGWVATGVLACIRTIAIADLPMTLDVEITSRHY